jgi:hypothetical protein
MFSTKLSAANVAELVESQRFPFIHHANATGFFLREPDVTLRAKTQAHVVAVANDMGIHTVDELVAAFEKASGRSANYFRALACSSKSSAWLSETDFLFLLALVAAHPDRIEAGHLVELGWSQDLAESTIGIARRSQLH